MKAIKSKGHLLVIKVMGPIMVWGVSCICEHGNSIYFLPVSFLAQRPNFIVAVFFCTEKGKNLHVCLFEGV